MSPPSVPSEFNMFRFKDIPRSTCNHIHIRNFGSASRHPKNGLYKFLIELDQVTIAQQSYKYFEGLFDSWELIATKIYSVQIGYLSN